MWILLTILDCIMVFTVTWFLGLEIGLLFVVFGMLNYILGIMVEADAENNLRNRQE